MVVLMFFFMNYECRAKAFQGKRIILFRLLIILPIAYEVGAIFIKYFATMGYFTIPSPLFFLLPSKPPLVFAAFVLIVIFLKVAEVRYLRRPGNTREMYERHITTKAHALKISILISVIFAILAFADLALFVGLALSTIFRYTAEYSHLPQTEIDLLISYRISVFESIGFGGATGLFLAIPIVMLFSYTKTHSNPKVDILIPIAGIALIAVVLLEGFFQVITLNLPNFLDKLRKALEGDDGGEAPQAISILLSQVKDTIHLL